MAMCGSSFLVVSPQVGLESGSLGRSREAGPLQLNGQYLQGRWLKAVLATK